MQAIQGSNLTSLRGIQDFLDANADKLAGVATSGQRRKLDDLVAELQGHAQGQANHDLVARGATKSKAALAQELRYDHMRPIARIAAADAPDIPALAAFRQPQGSVTIEQLVELANGMADAAQPYAQQFIDAGLPPSFLDDLRSKSQALIQATKQQKVTVAKRAGTTSGLRTRTSTTRRVVAALDALVKRATKDETLLDNWKSVKHVRRGPAPAPASTPAPAPASAPTATPSPTAPAIAAA